MYRRLLVPVIEAHDWGPAADHAIDLAAETDATVYGLYVIELKPSYTRAGHSGLPFDDEIAEAERRGRAELRAFGDRAADRGVAFEPATRKGSVHRKILDYAVTIGADAIVMALPTKHRWLRRVWPDHFDRVIGQSTVPVIGVT